MLPFYKLNSDPEVMEFLPKLLSRQESDAFAQEMHRRIEKNGWGLWALAEQTSGKFIGFVGLNRPKVDLPCSPCMEIGWRLAKEYWGKGYATEAGRKSLHYAFATLVMDEVVSFTALINQRSEAVMRRLGMVNSENNFAHPSVAANSQLSEHVLYKISREQWQVSS